MRYRGCAPVRRLDFDAAFVLRRAPVRSGAQWNSFTRCLVFGFAGEGRTHGCISLGRFLFFAFGFGRVWVVYVRSFKRGVAYVILSCYLRKNNSTTISSAVPCPKHPDRLRVPILQRARRLFLTLPPSRPSTTKSDLPSRLPAE